MHKTEVNETIVFPPPPAKARIQYLTSINTSSDIKGKQSAFNKYVFGEPTPLPIVKPYGISINKSKIYISDTGIKGLEIIDLKEGSFNYFIPKGLGRLQLPINCAVDVDGHLYIADGGRKQIVIFNSELEYLDAFSLENECKPTDVTVRDSLIWVSAVDDHSIHVYSKKTLNFKNSFPENKQSLEEYLYQPANIVMSDSSILVSDIGACRIVELNLDQSFRLAFGKSGRGLGEFTRPKGISTDQDRNIYVVDAAFENVQIFNPEGILLMSFGGGYSGPGGMSLPAGITTDSNNNEYFSKYVNERFKLQHLIFVTNQYGPNKVNVYGFIASD